MVLFRRRRTWTRGAASRGAYPEFHGACYRTCATRDCQPLQPRALRQGRVDFCLTLQHTAPKTPPTARSLTSAAIPCRPVAPQRAQLLEITGDHKRVESSEPPPDKGARAHSQRLLGPRTNRSSIVRPASPVAVVPAKANSVHADASATNGESGAFRAAIAHPGDYLPRAAPSPPDSGRAGDNRIGPSNDYWVWPPTSRIWPRSS